MFFAKEVGKMSTVNLLNENIVSVIEESEREIIGEKITYRLYRIDFVEMTRFAISAVFGKEREICLLGSDVSAAEKIYDTVCRNTVTPCTLPCIIEDFCSEIY